MREAAAIEHIDALDHLVGQAVAELAALREALGALRAARAAARQRTGGLSTDLAVLAGGLSKAESRLGRALADAEACDAQGVYVQLATVMETVGAIQAAVATAPAPGLDVEAANLVAEQEACFLCHTLACLAVRAVGLAEAAGVRFGVENAGDMLAPLSLPTALAALCEARAAGEEAEVFAADALTLGGAHEWLHAWQNHARGMASPVRVQPNRRRRRRVA